MKLYGIFVNTVIVSHNVENFKIMKSQEKIIYKFDIRGKKRTLLTQTVSGHTFFKRKEIFVKGGCLSKEDSNNT